MVDFLWNDLLVNPLTNALIILSNVLFDNFGLALIAFTIIIRVATYPLTRKQLRATRAMSEMQPRLQEIQKQYKDPKRRQQEMMKAYKEAGFNPLGCAVPMLIQLPIWIALFQVIRRTLGSTPEALIDLSSRLYDWSYITEAVPLSRDFLGLDLASNGGIPMAILVGLSTFYQQKLSTSRSAARDDKQAGMSRTMLWMMPLMFGWFTLTFPNGLAIYWLSTGVVGIVMAYLYNRPKNLTWRWLINLDALPAPTPAAGKSTAAAVPAAVDEDEERRPPTRRRRRRR